MAADRRIDVVVPRQARQHGREIVSTPGTGVWRARTMAWRWTGEAERVPRSRRYHRASDSVPL